MASWTGGGHWNLQIVAGSVRSTGNLDLQLVSEVEGILVGLSPWPVESDAVSREIMLNWVDTQLVSWESFVGMEKLSIPTHIGIGIRTYLGPNFVFMGHKINLLGQVKLLFLNPFTYFNPAIELIYRIHYYCLLLYTLNI